MLLLRQMYIKYVRKSLGVQQIFHNHIIISQIILTSGTNPDSKVHGANMGPTWVLSAPDGPHIGPMSLAIRVYALRWWGICHSLHPHCPFAHTTTITRSVENAKPSSNGTIMMCNHSFAPPPPPPQKKKKTKKTAIQSNSVNRSVVADCDYLVDEIKKSNNHDDVIKWIYFPRYWPFVRGIHQSPKNYPHKGQWRGALMLIFLSAPE